jgi:predicted TIM-barrel fold metal-dependent hydrolase
MASVRVACGPGRPSIPYRGENLTPPPEDGRLGGRLSDRRRASALPGSYEAAELAAAFPRTAIVVNHTGLPADRSEPGLAGWRHAIRAVASCPGVAVKISGLGQPDRPWTLEASAPVIRDAIGIFGVDRVMLASSFPVDGLVGRLGAIFPGVRRTVADLPVTDQRKLFNDNAVRIHRLGQR